MCFACVQMQASCESCRAKKGRAVRLIVCRDRKSRVGKMEPHLHLRIEAYRGGESRLVSTLSDWKKVSGRPNVSPPLPLMKLRANQSTPPLPIDGHQFDTILHHEHDLLRTGQSSKRFKFNPNHPLPFLPSDGHPNTPKMVSRVIFWTGFGTNTLLQPRRPRIQYRPPICEALTTS